MCIRDRFPPGDAREDWTILRALSEKLGKTLPFDKLEELRAAMAVDCPDLAALGLVTFPWAPPALGATAEGTLAGLSLIHISEPTRLELESRFAA